MRRIRLVGCLTLLMVAGCLGQVTPPSPPPTIGTPGIVTPTPFAGPRPSPPPAASPVATVTSSQATASRPTATAGPPPLLVVATVDTARSVRPISPLIYGLAWEDSPAIRPTLRRWGGNFATRYNWELGDAFNAAADWEFRNVDYGNSATTRQPSGMADQFIGEVRRSQSAVMMTVPAVGWVARNRDTETRAGAVPADGGRAIGPTRAGAHQGHQGAIAGYDPSDNRARTSIRSVARKGAPFRFPPNLEDEVVYQDEWIAHLVKQFGRAADGGVRFFAIDNEPDLWSVTHRDIHPAHMGYATTLAVYLEYATMIKEIDPTAEVVGPVISGWLPIFFSAEDRGTDNYLSAADRRAHREAPFLAWFLDQVKAHDERTGRRNLDVLAVNWYPQAGEFLPGGTDAETNARRLRATRQLWDPAYRDESWIVRTRDAGGDGAVRLIPRLRELIDRHYPGTRLGITEWNYGADDTLNGALTIAEVLGIFGREGVDLAAYWRAPKDGSPGALAFQLYRNVDGRGGHFGDQVLGVQRQDSLHYQISLFASRDSSSGTVSILLINKDQNRPAQAQLRLTGSQLADRAEVYRYGGEALTGIVTAPPIPVSNEQLVVDLPAYSITVVRLPARP